LSITTSFEIFLHKQTMLGAESTGYMLIFSKNSIQNASSV